jgi:metal-responsive CopG/Arc/MetJ family transcriptional regulator
MTTARVNTTLDSDLLARIDAYAERNLEDRSTAIRQLVDSPFESTTRLRHSAPSKQDA